MSDTETLVVEDNADLRADSGELVRVLLRTEGRYLMLSATREEEPGQYRTYTMPLGKAAPNNTNQ